MNKCYKKTESVVTREIAGETMLIPITSQLADMQQIFALDAVSALIWSLLDGTHTLQVYRLLDQPPTPDSPGFFLPFTDATSGGRVNCCHPRWVKGYRLWSPATQPGGSAINEIIHRHVRRF